MTKETAGVSLKPLYRQVREMLTLRLIEGDWQPGEVIPSEIQLAQELGVSQGTVRKALDEMVRDNILRRKQGRGTFVAKSDDAEFVFQFFRIQPDQGERVLPTSEVHSVTHDHADGAVADRLQIPPGCETLTIERVRRLNEQPVIAERVILRSDQFDGFPDDGDLPNNLYNFYAQKWGIRVGRTDEWLKAVPAGQTQSQLLGCPEFTPLLRVERVALDLSGNPIELRISDCLTRDFHYSNRSG